MDKKILNRQAQHWENAFSSRQDSKKFPMFGVSPSAAAIKSAETFKKEGVTNILELGAGQGRDTLFFASNEIIKFLISVLLIAPFAFFMGMPFPLGLAWLEKHFKEGIPWLGGLMDALL